LFIVFGHTGLGFDFAAGVETAVRADAVRADGLVAVGAGDKRRENNPLGSPAFALAHGAVAAFL